MKRGLRLLVGMIFMLQATSLIASPRQPDGLDADDIALVEELSSMSLTDGKAPLGLSRTPTPGCLEPTVELAGRRSASLRGSPAAGSPRKFGMKVKPPTCFEEALLQLRKKFSLDEQFLKIAPIKGVPASVHIFLDPIYCRSSGMSLLIKTYGDAKFIACEVQEKMLATHLQTVVDAILACLKEYAVSGAMLTVWSVDGMQPIVFPADTAVECELI